MSTVAKLSQFAVGGITQKYDYPANAAGFLIHSAVHKARPDAVAACHTHSPYGKAWSSFCRPLEMLNQDVTYFYGDAQAVYEVGRDLLPSDLTFTASTSAGKASANSVPTDQLFKSRICRSNTGLINNSSESVLCSRQSAGSYGQLQEIVRV